MSTMIVWRDWFEPAAVAKMTEMGTLPRTETWINTSKRTWRGDEIAEEIAEQSHNEDPEAFRNGGKIVILEPPEFAGVYRIDVDWDPTFLALKEE